MYIAFKWLFGLVIIMWLNLCCIDIYVVRKSQGNTQDFNETSYSDDLLKKQKKEIHSHRINHQSDNAPSLSLFHYFMFFAGVLSVTVYNKKKQIAMYTKNTAAKVYNPSVKECVVENVKKFKITACGTARFAALKCAQCTWGLFIYLKTNIQDRRKANADELKMKLFLINKIIKLKEERDHLTELYVAALRANKCIRMQYHLEKLAKNRLLVHVKNVEKQMKDNKVKYNNFERLYSQTHQENLFLKARLRQLKYDRENALKDLMYLISEIYKSSNDALKMYCSSYMNNARNVISADLRAEIQSILLMPRPHISRASSSAWAVDEAYNRANVAKSWTRSQVRVAQDKENRISTNPDRVEFKNVPGEYIWTIKDKSGLIEKLFQYDYEYDFGNNETIERIREYNVSQNKNTTFDLANLNTIIESDKLRSKNSNSSDVQWPLTDASTRQCLGAVTVFPKGPRFLTESEAFQSFMKSSQNQEKTVPLRTSMSLCE